MAPTTDPALVPITMSGTIPWASSALMTPMCAKPLAAPPPRASAMTGLGFGVVVTDGAAVVGGVLLQPAIAKSMMSHVVIAIIAVFEKFI